MDVKASKTFISDAKMTFNGSTGNLLFAICLVVILSKVNLFTVYRSPERSHSLCFKTFCYFVGYRYFDWHRAKKYCENIGGSLASIHSTEENEFLQRLLRVSNSERRKMWIGLNSFNSDGTFQWSDWTEVNFLYFAANESNNFLYEERCCNINGTNGLWNSDHCSNRYGFICKQANATSVSTVIPTTQDPRMGNCKEGWIPHFDRCYYIGGKKVEERLNWTEAKSFCEMNGGYLTSIRNLKEDRFLGYLLQIIGEDAWIGLLYKKRYHTYFWIDNSELTYLGLHKLYVSHKCFKMMYNDKRSGAWGDDKCDRKLGFICQTSKDPKLPPLPTHPDINCVQPKGWMKLNNMCFKMFEESPLTWNEAELSCKNEGGHLASVTDLSVKALASYLEEEMDQSFFIGLEYDKDSRSFKWLNNFPVSLTEWAQNEPSFITENTCFASTDNGAWKKTPCDEKMPYLCQITIDKPKKLKYVGNCSSSSNLWIPGNNSYCYIPSQNEKLDYFQASLICEKFGSHLIALHSLEESKEVVKLMNPGVRSVFLGIYKTSRYDGYKWNDDSPLNFVNWDEEEPLHIVGKNDDECVEMMTDSMKWRITPCENERSYICMDVKSTLVVEDLDDFTDSGYFIGLEKFNFYYSMGQECYRVRRKKYLKNRHFGGCPRHFRKRKKFKKLLPDGAMEQHIAARISNVICHLFNCVQRIGECSSNSGNCLVQEGHIQYATIQKAEQGH